jgi:hypothetical protein
MSNIDMKRCLRGTFHDHETFTPEQRALAESLIQDGPPNNRQIVLKKQDTDTWNAETNTLTRDGISVRIKVPQPAPAGVLHLKAVTGQSAS